MKLRKSKFALAVLCLTAFASVSMAQPGTLEMTSTGSSNTALGPSTAPVTVTFREDIQNLVFGTHFKPYAPALTMTTSFANQQYNTTYGNISTGMVFGAGNTGSTGAVQQAQPWETYNVIGAHLVQPPQNGMFVSSPTGFTVANWQAGGRGVGLDPEGTQNGLDDSTANFDQNFGTAVFVTVEPLWDANLPKDGRYYYGDLVLTFNRPVLNPIVHIGGLGGSYNYQPAAGGPRLISYFSTELELQTPGVTSTFMSGNEFFNISGNNILNSAPRPNGGSYDDGSTQGGFSTYGAATGSVRISGVVTQLVYKVYVRGSVNSDFNFSQNAVNISGATRDPLNGDLFYVAVSLNKPTQQISGNVYNDRDALADNSIYQSYGLPNAKATNTGVTLYANLINSSGLVVASTAVSAGGSYLFDNVPVGTYTVQLTTNPSAGTYATPLAPPATALPSGWANTGELNGLGTGSDGTPNGLTAAIPVAANDIKTEINFGIRIAPCSANTLFLDLPFNTNYFGGFESGTHNFDSVIVIDGPVKRVAKTKLTPANYNIVYSPDQVAGSGFSAFTPVGGLNQMVVKTTSASDTTWYLQDSALKAVPTFPPGQTIPRQVYFKKQSGVSSFSGWFTKVNTGVDPQIKIVVYDADSTNKIYGTVTQTLTGTPGVWKLISVPITIPRDSVTKRIRYAIISTVNNSSFAMDNLCAPIAPAGPVAITLADFTASKVNCTANLVWKTATEINADRFEIEASTDNSNTFAKVGTVAASGTAKTYQLSYPMQTGVVYYFRLKMIDKDGTFKLSDIRSLSCTDGKFDIIVNPNPVRDRFYISGMERGINNIAVFAMNGQKVKTQVIEQTQGYVDISTLPAGMYNLRITAASGFVTVKKLIKD